MGLFDNESLFTVDEDMYTKIMNVVNNEAAKKEAEYNEQEQENEKISTPEQRKVSFLRSRNIDTEMDLEAQEQVNKDMREQQHEQDGQGNDISEN